MERWWPFSHPFAAASNILKHLLEENQFCKDRATPVFWQNRPSRLPLLLAFDCQSCSRKFELLELIESEINRLPCALQFNYYRPETIELLKQKFGENFLGIDRLDKARLKPANGVTMVPVAHDCRNQYQPDISFSGFTEIAESLIPEGHQKSVNKLKRLCDHFWLKKGNTYWLQIADFTTIKGHSYELGYFVHAWLKMYNTIQLPGLCCTGEVDSNGRIREVKHFERKMAAAMAANFVYCLVPAGNLRDSRYSGDPRFFGFNHIDEVAHWLLEHSETLPARTEIRNWLANNRDTAAPDARFFSLFFNQTLDKPGNQISLWKTTLGQNPAAEKCDKLRILLQQLLNFLHSENAESQKTLPMMCATDLYYSLAVDMLLRTTKDSQIQCEKLYHELSASLLDSNLEVVNASERLQTKNLNNYFQNPSLKMLRRRYPIVFSLFYLNPVDMLFFFSQLPDYTDFESNLLDNLLICLEHETDGFSDFNSLRLFEARVIHRLHQNLSSVAYPARFDLQSTPRKFEKLLTACRGFNKKADKKALTVCKLFFHRLIRLVTKSDIEASEVIALIEPHLASASNERHIPESLLSDPRFKRLFGRLNSATKKSSETDNLEIYEKAAANLIEFMKSQSSKFSPALPWFPQPAFALSFKKNHCLKIIESFTQSYSGSGRESAIAKGDCLAHWAGFLSGKEVHDKTDETLSVKMNSLPWLVGWFTGLFSRHTFRCNVVDQAGCRLRIFLAAGGLKDYARLFWLKLAPQACQKCLNPLITGILATAGFRKLKSESAVPEKEQKNYIGFLFALALFSKKEKTAWVRIENDFFTDPYAVRRTAQLLIPVFQLLREPARLPDTLHKIWGMNNNSHFVVEYLRTFCLSEAADPLSLKCFRPVQWQMSLDRQMYNTICISHLADNSEALRQFILEKIDDLPNLFLALSRLP